jgi:hypothetical protein
MHEHIVEEFISKPRANAAPSCRRGNMLHAGAAAARCAPLTFREEENPIRHFRHTRREGRVTGEGVSQWQTSIDRLNECDMISRLNQIQYPP